MASVDCVINDNESDETSETAQLSESQGWLGFRNYQI